MNNARHLKKVLLQPISTLSQQKEKFLFNPRVDFTRKRKLSFDELIKFVICMESGTIKDELYKYFGLSGNGVTVSAFIQHRSKIKHEAFKYIFEVFNEKTIQFKSYKGYRLIAVDGSTLPISIDISDSETYSLNHGKNEKGYNAFHLHASYDLLEHTYDDIIIEGEAKYNENAAFIDIVDRYTGKKQFLSQIEIMNFIIYLSMFQIQIINFLFELKITIVMECLKVCTFLYPENVILIYPEF